MNNRKNDWTLAVRLERYVRGQQPLDAALITDVERYALKVAHRVRGIDWARRYGDDVRQEVWLKLLEWRGGSIRGLPANRRYMIRQASLAAIRAIGSQFVAPGERTRRHGEDVAYKFDADAIGAFVSVVTEHGPQLASAPDPQATAAYDRLEWQLTFVRILRGHASHQVIQALVDLLANDNTLQDAARGAGLSRDALNRHLKALRAVTAAAA